jgi:hypothetical protein
MLLFTIHNNLNMIASCTFTVSLGEVVAYNSMARVLGIVNSTWELKVELAVYAS